jgi:hypothetical protein
MNHSAPAEMTYKENRKGMELKVQCTTLCSARKAKNVQAAPRYAAST